MGILASSAFITIVLHWEPLYYWLSDTFNADIKESMTHMDLWQILFERSQGPRFPGLVHDRGTVLRKYKLSHLQLSVGDHPS